MFSKIRDLEDSIVASFDDFQLIIHLIQSEKGKDSQQNINKLSLVTTFVTVLRDQHNDHQSTRIIRWIQVRIYNSCVLFWACKNITIGCIFPCNRQYLYHWILCTWSNVPNSVLEKFTLTCLSKLFFWILHFGIHSL